MWKNKTFKECVFCLFVLLSFQLSRVSWISHIKVEIANQGCIYHMMYCYLTTLLQWIVGEYGFILSVVLLCHTYVVRSTLWWKGTILWWKAGIHSVWRSQCLSIYCCNGIQLLQHVTMFIVSSTIYFFISNKWIAYIKMCYRIVVFHLTVLCDIISFVFM